jgi:hypothetical protein
VPAYFGEGLAVIRSFRSSYPQSMHQCGRSGHGRAAIAPRGAQTLSVAKFPVELLRSGRCPNPGSQWEAAVFISREVGNGGCIIFGPSLRSCIDDGKHAVAPSGEGDRPILMQQLIASKEGGRNRVLVGDDAFRTGSRLLGTEILSLQGKRTPNPAEVLGRSTFCRNRSCRKRRPHRRCPCSVEVSHGPNAIMSPQFFANAQAPTMLAR